MISPTQRTLALLRKEGYVCQVVEKWNVHAGVKIDLFGCIDVVGVKADQPGVLGVQCTTRDNQAARMTKALAATALRTWLAAGNSFSVWGWGAVLVGKQRRWQVTRRGVTLADLDGGAKADV